MHNTDTLVSIGLPVLNGAERVETVIESVLTQDHENVELVICDNASTDDTEKRCRALAARDSRIVYHRSPATVTMLDNFIGAIRLARGTYFRWVGDDDWLAPNYVSRALETFEADGRLVLVTTQQDYTGPDGVTETAPYGGTALASDDPVIRFTEMLRLLNESRLLIDPLYGIVRREHVVHIARRNMLREDEVFAGKLALAGPWGHVPEVLAHRNFSHEKLADLARKLEVPGWQAHFSTTLQCRELLRWLAECDLTEQQRRRARLAVVQMYVRRQHLVLARRSRKLARIARDLVS